MNDWKRYLPWALLGLSALYLGSTMAPPRNPANGMKLSAFGQLIVIDGGRVKPIDSFARINLMVMNRRQTYYDEFDQKQEALRWLLNIFAEGYGDYLSVVTIPDREVQAWFGLPERPSGHYAMREVLVHSRDKAEQLGKLMQQGGQNATPVEKRVMLTAMDVVDRSKTIQEIREVQKKHGSPERARVFRIDYDQLLAMLGLEQREGFRYSLTDFAGESNRSQFQQFLKKAQQAKERVPKERDMPDIRALDLANQLKTHSELLRLGGVLMVPGATDDLEEWKTLGMALTQGEGRGDSAAASLEKIVRAYAMGNAKAFNQEVEAYRSQLQKRFPAEMKRARIEAWFNHFAPFYQCANLYVLMFLLAVLSWVVWPVELGRSAFWLGLLLAIVHTFALGLRMYLQGRPPVTNLYSSAVFIGWGCVLLCLLVEYWYRNGVSSAVAAILGFATMVIAHHLGGSGDTMEMMQAVLDTNFWLATHVTTITLGYTATFVAGFFATVFIYRMLCSTLLHFYQVRTPISGSEQAAFVASVIGVVGIPAGVLLALIFGLWVLWTSGESLRFGVGMVLALPAFFPALICGYILITRRQAPNGLAPGVSDTLDRLSLTTTASRALAGMVYGTVCFATFLSFVGTVLGGIWADQSWGRFWGWDPKENGALLIVIINALILHARWGGMIKERGLATLALVGNMVTAWSWFGTNQLGVGLHAYGFNNSLATGCSIFWVSQLGLLGLGLLPLNYWRLYREKAAVVAPATVPSGPTKQKPGRRKQQIQPA